MEVVVKSMSALAGKCLLFVCLSVLFLAPFVSAAPPDEPIRIGVVLSISGWGGFMGTPAKEAFEALTENINRNGGVLGRKLELIIEDDQSNPTNAVIAVTKLIRDRKVSLIMGPTMTDAGMAMIPVCEQEKTPFVATCPLTGTFKKFTFMLGPGDVRSAQHILEYAVKDLGKKRIALFHGTDNYGMTAAKTLKQEIARYPEASFVIEEKFEIADTNMIPQLTLIKSANPDLLILYTAGTTAAIIAKNYKQMGIKVPVLGSSGMAIPQFLKIAGPIAEESKWTILGTRALVGEKFPESAPFRRNLYDPLKRVIRNKYGSSKEIVTFYTGPYDAMNVVVEALKLAGTDNREQLRDALEKVRVPEGFLGVWECSSDDHQAARKDVMIPLYVKNGEWFPVD
jgi:branched-chain amino acid transport system substrate-binding protein